MQGLREQHKEDRRQRILLEARQLIASGGLESLTMRTLAAASELSVPTIYNLVGDRAAVLAALMNAGGERFDAELPNESEDLIAALRDAAKTLANVITEHRAVVAAVLSGSGTVEIGPAQDGTFGRFGVAIERALDRARVDGTIDRKADVPLLRERIQAMAAGSVIAWAHDHGDDRRLRDDLAHGSLLVVFAYLASDQFDEARTTLDQISRRIRKHRTGSRSQSRARVARGA